MDSNKLKTYSQHGEDDLVWKYYDKRSTGLVIEVGAFDGVHFSNSYALEKLGWKAIVVEPHPKYFPLVEKNRPNAVRYNCAAVGDEHTTEISFIAEELGLLSGIDIDLEDVRKRYDNRGLEFNEPEKVSVQARTLNSILKEQNIQPGEIDCISIDVEGAEMEVLKGIDLQYYKPGMLIMESNTPETTQALTSYFALQKDYHMARKMKVNLIFVHGKKNINKAKNIEVDAELAEQEHPLGEKYTIEAKIDKAPPTPPPPGPWIQFKHWVKTKIFRL